MEDFKLSRGVNYELKLISRVLFNSEFGEEVIFDFEPTLFEEQNHKRTCLIIRNYHQRYGSLPNIDNIRQIIPTEIQGETEAKMINASLDKMVTYRKQVESGQHNNDYEHIENEFYSFIKKQKLKQLNQELQEALELGDDGRSETIIEKLRDAKDYGIKKDFGYTLNSDLDDLDNLFDDSEQEIIPTGFDFIDNKIGGGRKGDLHLFLTGQGVGKTTLLTMVANNAQLLGYNVLHIFFEENKPKHIKQKHISKWIGWTDVECKANKVAAKEAVRLFKEKNLSKMGHLAYKQFISEGITIPKIRDWIMKYTKKYGVVFDVIVIDYIEEIESHKGKDHNGNSWDGPEVHVAKAIKSLAAELNAAVWSATQSKKEANHLRILDKTHVGGSVAKIKKAQLVITAGRDLVEQRNNIANIAIAKCNYGGAGEIWEGCVLDNARLILKAGFQSSETLEDFDEDMLIELEQKKALEKDPTIAIIKETKPDKRSVVMSL